MNACMLHWMFSCMNEHVLHWKFMTHAGNNPPKGFTAPLAQQKMKTS